MSFIKLYISASIIMLIGIKPILGTNIDNIINTFFYAENDSSYLILHESIYHPTTGSYEQGNMRSEGYNTSRISVYCIDDGKLVVQKHMGVMDSTEACFVLGCSDNNLWVYCNKYKSGLQSLYPLTLNRNISQAKIYKKLNISVGRLSEPKWQVINEHYGFDAIQQKLIVTNTLNKQFYIDVKTFATQPIFQKINLIPEFNNYLSQSAVFNDSVWRLSGYKQMKLECGDYKASNPEFLYGKFILEQNKVRLFKHFFTVIEELIFEKEEFERLGNNILSKKTENIIQNLKDNIEAIIGGLKPDDVLLQTGANLFFVLSKSGSVSDAIIKISEINSKQFGDFDIRWSVSIPGMFYNVSQARNTKAFKKYYGDIFPEFDYQFIQVHNNKLIIIYLLQVCCIDTNNGNILWQFKLI